MSPPYYNRYPHLLEQEREAAREAGIVPVSVPSAAFDLLAMAGVDMIFVVLTGGGLVAVPRQQRYRHISHAVLASGAPVLAAGEFAVEYDGTMMIVSALNDMSGHYQPGTGALAVAAAAFEGAGFGVRPDAITSYDWEAP